jgi:hypothetical protein
MAFRHAYLTVVVSVSLLLSCRVQDAGTSNGSLDAGTRYDTLADMIGTIDGGHNGIDAPVRGGAGGVVDSGPVLGTGGAGGQLSPPDAPVMEAPGPACAAPMKECAGACIAADGCCQDRDCPAMTTGKIGKCDSSSHVCQYMCGADSKPCGGVCVPQAACCSDSECTNNLACVASSCSTTECRMGFKRCGNTCIANAACCRADGCCANSDCGTCQKCAQGRCVNQGGNEDLKNECANGTCRTGTCNGAGACEASPDGQNGPGCAGECQNCQAGVCAAHAGMCGMGQTCENGRCPPRPPVAIRINVNGPQHGMFAADVGAGGVCSGSSFITDRPIAGTTDDPLYQSEIFGAPATCAVGGGTLPPGSYKVNLHFAEIYFGPTCVGGGVGLGARVFDIQLEGTTVASNVDIFSEGGCAAGLDGLGHPVIKRFTLDITDGTLNINLPAQVNNGKISAIEVLSNW